MSTEVSTVFPGSDAGERQSLPLQGRSLPLYVEQLDVSRRRVATALVRAATTTHRREQRVEEDLVHERVEVERVAIGRVVDAVPPVRVEGDTTILSVVEEEVVVQRRLVLKEEVHVRRVAATQRHVETVVLREQDVAVTRTPLQGSPASAQPPYHSQPKDDLP